MGKTSAGDKAAGRKMGITNRSLKGTRRDSGEEYSKKYKGVFGGRSNQKKGVVQTADGEAHKKNCGVYNMLNPHLI